MRQTKVNTHKAQRRYQIICFMVCFFWVNLQSFGQTWVMQDTHKLLENKTYEVDSIIGNGNTLYFQCGSSLKINRYAVNVKFATMRSSDSNCEKTNEVKIAPRAYVDNVRYPFKCIIINGNNIKPRLTLNKNLP